MQDAWNATSGIMITGNTMVTPVSVTFSGLAPEPKTNVDWLRGRVAEICEFARAA